MSNSLKQERAQTGLDHGSIRGHMHIEQLPDPRYANVCVELTEYAPVELFSMLKLS